MRFLVTNSVYLYNSQIYLTKSTRATNDLCNCFICYKAKYNGQEIIDKGADHKRKLSNRIDKSNGLFINGPVNKYLKKSEDKES